MRPVSLFESTIAVTVIRSLLKISSMYQGKITTLTFFQLQYFDFSEYKKSSKYLYKATYIWIAIYKYKLLRSSLKERKYEQVFKITVNII